MGKMAAVIPLFKAWQLCWAEEEPIWCVKLTFSGPSGFAANNKSQCEQGLACASHFLADR